MQPTARDLAPRFELGRVLMTPAFQERAARAMRAFRAEDMSPQQLASGVARALIELHLRLDQGALCDEDHAENRRALEEGARIFSAFDTPLVGRVWVITEADRSATTVLLPEDY